MSAQPDPVQPNDTAKERPGVPADALPRNADEAYCAARDFALAHPEDLTGCRQFALACERLGDFTAGLPFCADACARFPHDGDLLSVYATLLAQTSGNAQGLALAQAGLERLPGHSRLLLCAATLLGKLQQPLTALELLTHAPLRDQSGLEADNLLLQRSLLYRDAGESRLALRDLQQVLAHQPLLREARSNFLLFLHDVPGIAPEELFAAHLAFGRDFGHPAALPLPRTSRPAEPLRLGFVSSDLRQHSVACFLLPLLRHLDPAQATAILYSNTPREDEVTRQFRQTALWRDIRPLSDPDARALIRADGIDILFDLNGHTAHNRLGLFLARSAPVQINWLGYPDTTGIPAMDYRFVDAATDPAPDADRLATERLIRLPAGFLCYAPCCSAPAVAPAPTQCGQNFTFGSFSNFAKVSPELLDLWAEILRRAPGTRLMLKSIATTEPAGQARLRSLFTARGVDDARILPCPRLPDAAAHLTQYAQIDLALDTFPYNGTTTSCEALYMGVPVLTLRGQTHAARVGSAILERLGLPALIARSADEYVAKAAALAAQPQDLARLRPTLRDRLCACGLTDAPRFAAAFLSTVRGLWEQAPAACGGEK